MSDLDVHLSAIAAGDPDAFGRWVAGCELRLRASLSRFSSSVDVEAIVQETLLRVWQVAPRVEPDGRPDCLVRLAIRIARNLAVSEIRRAGPRSVELAEEAAVEEAHGGIEPDPLLRRLVAACRQQLPDKPAAALTARLARGGALPDRALAAELGMQLNTFLQNVGRARRLLLECLERHGVELEEMRP